MIPKKKTIMDEETAWFETILNKNIHDNAVTKILNMTVDKAVADGTNYSSDVYRVTLNLIHKNGQKNKITLIMKKQFKNEVKAKMNEKVQIFKNEITFYTNILTKYDQLMNEYQDSNDSLWCNLVGYTPYSAIVFEDLKASNFQLANRIEFLDKNHSLLVANGLGKFHALGCVAIEKGLLHNNDFQPPFLSKKSFVLDNLLHGGFRQLCKVIDNSWSSEWKEISKRLIQQINLMAEKLNKLYEKRNDCFQTILHGDCWTGNILFKYCPYDDKIPTALKFVDFQGVHMNTFAFDLTYFLHMGVRQDIRRQYLNEILNEYHRSLKETLTFYGFGEKTPSMDDVKAEIKRLEYYGFIVNLIFLPITCAVVKDAFKQEPLLKKETAMDAFNPEVFNSKIYKDAVQTNMKQWFDEGLF